MIGTDKQLKFKMLYKGTRDGFSFKELHQKCQNAGGTISIVKTTEDRVFGSYTNIAWSCTGNWI